MQIIGNFEKEDSFKLTAKPENMAQAHFVAIPGNGFIHSSRRLTDLFYLHDDCQVVANWHGERRTDAFITTIGHLRKLASEYKP